jgi:2-hydroxy-3-oxopropionate reductase
MWNIGFIGLGAMGIPMASRLRQAGHRLTVYARRDVAMQPLVALGATPCESVAALAARSDVVFVMVTDTADVEAVTVGEAGLVHAARPGTVVIVMSTIAPSATRKLAARLKTHGIDMLDAPVSGGVAGAEAGTLAIMVGGDAAVFERCRALLECLGRTIVYIGPSGAGMIAKACTQICIVVNQLGVAEALLLAEKAGVDPRRVQQALAGGFAASRILDVQAPKMIARDFTGKIESRLHHKDIHIVLALARELGLALPASTAAAEVLTRLQEAGGAKQDSAAVLTVLERP